ncbi:hypothetical protein LIER_32607 [Lithospermum erythrorhizon]|uniref:DDE Tnp4 domain-containing protein n=1 Tax=Lithospermum erythrorhizon TaxID=34254 RepID=A0AAV3RV92_LITER
MGRIAFQNLCALLEKSSGLTHTKNMYIDEQVALTLYILAHHHKNRVINFNFNRSKETVSRHFRSVINAIIRLHHLLLKNPQPVSSESTDERWKWFQGCLGALDGTYIKVCLPLSDRPRYRTRKGEIARNVLGVCSPEMQFLYVFPGGEGSTADGRVLRDTITRRNGSVVPHDSYYLLDGGYTNCEGFLAPFRGQRYHLNDWRAGYQPNTSEEFFNMKHSSARNVIERCFGILKARWGILRSTMNYPITMQSRIIMACCLLHNFIRYEMKDDPMENEQTEDDDNLVEGNEDQEVITTIGTSNEWTQFRANMAIDMFNTWQTSRHD